MKLFVDDFRECPEGWTQAKTITQAIRLLCTQDVEEVSLDHDIQCTHNGCYPGGFESFETVAWFLAQAAPDTYKIRIHTGNVEAGRRMAEIMGIDYNNEIFNLENYK